MAATTFPNSSRTRPRGNEPTAKAGLKEVRVPARHLYTCLEPKCNFQFRPTAGTIFHDTQLPLEKWFQAVALMCNAKKGLSAKQMERDPGVTYRTAWYLNHRIRKTMEDKGASHSEELFEVSDSRHQRLRIDESNAFHKVSVKHMRRYLDEFTFRFNNRKAEDLFGLVMLNLVIATAIKYRELIFDRRARGGTALAAGTVFLGLGFIPSLGGRRSN